VEAQRVEPEVLLGRSVNLRRKNSSMPCEERLVVVDVAVVVAVELNPN
jgi:hypothetical protein